MVIFVSLIKSWLMKARVSQIEVEVANMMIGPLPQPYFLVYLFMLKS